MPGVVIPFYRVHLAWLVVRLLISRCWRSHPFRSLARSDRSGAQIHDDLMAASFCFRRGLRWAGSVGSDHFFEHARLCSLLGLPAPRQRGLWSLLPAYYREQVLPSGEPGPPTMPLGALKPLDRLLGLGLLSHEFPLDAEGVFNTAFVSHLRSACHISHSPYTGRRIVVHIRRGDVSTRAHPHRYTSNRVYLVLLDELSSLLGSDVQVTIHSQAASDEPFDSFRARGAVVKLDSCIEEAWRDMITADVLVMSKSSFSYVPGIYNPQIVLYQPFWHGCLPWWIDLSAPFWRDALLSMHLRLSRSAAQATPFS